MKKFLLSTLAATVFAATISAQISITATNNATTLAQSLAGNGVSITNAVLGAGTNGAGTFTANPNTNLGISSGVVLSTGNVLQIPQAASGFASTGNNGPTDANLQTLTNYAIDDVARLQFNVTPLGNKLTFRYVFASEEYPEYVCSNFNDVFGFFITGPNPNGPAYNAVNLATIPNTNIPVGINSINPGFPGQFGTASQCVSTAYSSLYRDNSSSTTIVFDGMTVVLTATVDVIPCQTYFLKLAVGDATDDIYDSGVFLEAGSFVSNTATINTAYFASGYSTTYEGCASATVTFNFTTPYVGSAMFDYVISGTATNGVDYQFLPGSVGVPAGGTSASIQIIPIQDNIVEGQETVIIELYLPCSTTPYASIVVPINDVPTLAASANDNTLCPGQVATLTATGAISYSWSPQTGLGSPNSAVTTANPPGDQIYTVTGTVGTCQNTVQVPIERSNLNISGAVTSIQCGASAIDLTVNDGKPTYTFNWNDGIQTEDRANLQPGQYTVTVTDAFACTAVETFNVSQPPAVIVSGTTTDIACFGGASGSITTSVLGGTPTYSYTWNDGNTSVNRANLGPGTYTVTVTDAAGCIGVASFTISEPQAGLSVVPQVTNTSCGNNDGEIVLIVTGGTPGYTYNWASTQNTATITGLAGGIYQVTVTDANNCTNVQTINVGSSATFSITATPSNQSCFGVADGSIDVTVTGQPIGQVNFVWNDNVQTQNRTGLTFGVYTVVATDASGCSAVAQATLIQAPQLQVNTSQTNVTCFGANNGSITLIVQGGTPAYGFVWSDQNTDSVRSGLSGGIYDVTVSDANGCTAERTITISEPSELNLNVQTTDASCSGAGGSASATATGGTPNYTFVWSTQVSGASVANLQPGNYNVTVFDSRGCTAVESFNITTPNPILLSELHTDITCFGLNDGAIDVTITGGTAPVVFGWVDNVQTEDRSGLAAGQYTITASDAAGCSASLTVTISEPTELIVNISKTDILCFGGNTGTANATITGGTPQYVFDWSTSIPGANQIGLTAGTYTLTVTDASQCSAIASVTIDEAQGLIASVTKTDATCNGIDNGTAQINVSGGTPQYGFDWNVQGLSGSSQTGLPAGNYDVTITDANNCTAFVTFIIGEDDPISLTGSSTPASCNGAADGSASVSAVGGTGTFSYAWSIQGQSSSSISGLTAGSYTVTVTDGNSCSAVENIFVSEPNSLQVTATPTDVTGCGNVNNGSIDVTVSGGNGGYQFVWADNGAITEDRTGLAPGNYTVVITDSKGCSATQSATVGANTQALIITAQVVDVTCGGANNGMIDLSVSGGTSPYSYLWADNSAVTQDRTNLSGGSYTVVVSDNAGCTNTATFVVNESPAITASAVSTNAGCDGANDGSINVTATGGTGQLSFVWNDQVQTEDRANLAPGTYTVVITDTRQCSFTLSVDIQQTSPIQLSQQSTDAKCNGLADGSATITATGGSGNYTYQWSQPGVSGASATGLGAGTYTVTVNDAGGCSAVTTFSIAQPAAILINTIATPNICFGNNDGTAFITVTGGNPPYNYAVELVNSGNPVNRLDGDFTQLAAGSYNARITDNSGCVANNSFNVIPAQEDLFDWNTTRTSCFGEEFKDGKIAAVALTTANAPFEYSFNGGAFTAQTEYENLAGGTYIFTTRNANGCTVNHQVTVTQPADISINFPAETLYVEMGHNTQLNANVLNADGVNFEWSAEKNPSYLDFVCAACSEQSPVTTTPFSNVYRLTVRDTANELCFKQGEITVVVANEIRVPTAFTPNGDNNNDRFYPVFNNKEVKLVEFRIYNRWGQIIHAESGEGWDGKYDGRAQPGGTYLYFLSYERLNIETGEVETKRKDGNFTLLR